MLQVFFWGMVVGILSTLILSEILNKKEEKNIQEIPIDAKITIAKEIIALLEKEKASEKRD